MHSREQEGGVAIIIALVFVVITGGLVVSGTLMNKSARMRADVRFRREAQAAHFAQSGMTEALSWFRRQTTQPCARFDPKRDTTVSPQILDTDEPEIGLVRQFQIMDGIWGRYEVWKEDESDLDAKRLQFRRQYQCLDLSLERGYRAEGSVWLVRSLGYVFLRRDANKRWNERPNRVLAMETVECEIQRPSFKLPGQAALCIDKGSLCTVNTNGQLIGGATGAGVFYPKGPAPNAGTTKVVRVTGSPAMSPTPTYEGGVRNVFGVTQDELRAMADIVITNAKDLPDPMEPGTIVYADCSMKISGPPMLNGGPCVLFVNGNIAMTASAYGRFEGLLYIKGNLSLRDDTEIRGALIVEGGSFTAQGVPDYATVVFDDVVLSSVHSLMGEYRWTGAFRSILNRE